MREISLEKVVQDLKEMIKKTNFSLRDDVKNILCKMKDKESSSRGKNIMKQIEDNYILAENNSQALCQDTGVAVFFVTLGEDVSFKKDGYLSLKEAINYAVITAYKEGFLRKSICSVFSRENSGDNTPVIIHFDLVSGDDFVIEFIAKGGGAENMSRLKMLTPAQGMQGVEDFIVQTILDAGPNACPPVVVGVGVGGSFDYVTFLAKKALLRDPVGKSSEDKVLAEMEKRILKQVNLKGYGAMGLGGDSTALAVHILSHPCHIASLPVAVNMNCHSHRVGTLRF